MSQRVYVGMSGGVDSSVTAALLVEQGYDVTGVYMKNWTQDLPGMRCPWADDLADAKRVAVQLKIPFKVYDFQTEYKQRVVDYMVAEYQAGRTPNPDIMCNQEVKFRLFLDAALADGADMIATGHYAKVGKTGVRRPESGEAAMNTNSAAAPHSSSPTQKVEKNDFLSAESRVGSEERVTAAASEPERDSSLAISDLRSPSSELQAFTYHLLRPMDIAKDQTYFLYRITKEALSRTLFPLGELTKPEVRAMAEERGLVTARKKDSQGICFVGSVGIKEFLAQYVAPEPGVVIDKDTGKTIGHHDGAIYYTIGQRHGLNLGGGLPYYVVGKDMAARIVYASRNLNDESMWRHGLTLSDIHWINDAPQSGDALTVRLRHLGKLIDCTLSGDELHLGSPERAITPGQSAVIYRGDECLGGGIICSQ